MMVRPDRPPERQRARAREFWELTGRAGRVWIGAGVASGLLEAAAVVCQAAVLASVCSAAMDHRLQTSQLDAWARELIAVALLLGSARALSELAAERAARRARASLRREGLAAASVLVARQQHPHLEASDGGLGALATELGSGVDGIDAFVGRYLPRAVLTVAVPLGLLGWIAHLDLLSAGLALIVLLVMPVLAALAGLGTARAVRERLATLERLGDRFVGLIRGLPLLIAYGRAQDHEAVVAEAADQTRVTTMATLRLALLSGLVLELLAAIGTALVAVPLGLRLDAGEQILPQAIAVLVITPEIYLPVRSLAADFHAGRAGSQVANGIWSLVSQADAGAARSSTTAPGDGPLPGPSGYQGNGVAVVVSDASYCYPGRCRPALASVNFSVPPGAAVALAGPSGSGKTTLLRLLAGLLSPTTGSVSVDGRAPVEQMGLSIGWVPQHPRVLNQTLFENVALGRAAVDAGRAERALFAVALGGLARDLGGLGTMLGEGGRALSMGERRRLAIARALSGSPPRLWLVDEPTEGLDDDAAEAVLGTLKRATAGTTLVLSTHDPRALVLANFVVEIGSARLGAPSGLRGVP
jgi:ATP-binding cassette subfamily C protein CydD